MEFKSLVLVFFILSININFGQKLIKESQNKLSLVYEINSNTEDEKSIIYSLDDYCVDSKGNLYIYDSKDYSIKKFDRNGKYIKTIGKKGKGPGELLNCTSITVDNYDNITIYDISNRRFSEYDNNGNYIKSYNYSYSVSHFKTIRNNNFIIEIYDYDFDIEHNKGFTIRKLLRYNKDLNDAHLIDSIRINNLIVIGGNMSVSAISSPFSYDFFWDMQSDSTLSISISNNLKTKIYSINGNLIGSFIHKFEKVKITGKEKQYIFEENRKGSENKKMFNKFIHFPKYKPFFSEMFSDDGNIYFGNYYRENNIIITKMNTKGNLLNKIVLQIPNSNVIKAIVKGEYLYVAYHDQNEFPVLRKYLLQDDIH